MEAMTKFVVPTPEWIKGKYLEKQNPQVARLLSLEPDFDWDVMAELDLSYSNLTQIVGLRLARNVRRLRLAHNGLRRIENLHWLTAVEQLDLSYNRIARIENLDQLTALTLLNLCANRVSVLENLDGNRLLDTLLISDNAIVDVQQLVYLSRFEHLRCLEWTGNPGAADEDSRQLVVDYLPRLRYLDYVHISVQERPGGELRKDSSAPVVGQHSAWNKEQLLRFLETMDGRQFINRLFKDDEDGKVLSKWNSTVRAAFEVYKRDIEEHAVEVYSLIVEKLKIRDDISNLFKKNYYNFEKYWSQKCRDMIAEFEVLKMIKISILSDSVNSSQSHEFEDTSVETVISFLESEIHSLTDRLHVTNIQMNRSISLMIYKYENILQEQVKEYYDLLVPIFFNLRETENAYSQVLTENVKLVVNNTQKLIPKVFMSRFENRYAIVQAAYQSTDKHLDMMFKREESIVVGTNFWLKSTIDELKNTENTRFWMVVEEAIKYREVFLTWIETLKFED